MTIRDLVMVAAGELVLAATFVLGICVGVSLARKDLSHDDGNEGTDG